MQHFSSSIKITSFDKKISENFIRKLILLGGHKSYRKLLKAKGFKIIKKKNTILKSPHIFKKFRDQIEIQHVSNFFQLQPKNRNFFKGSAMIMHNKGNNVLFNAKPFWFFFILNFKKYNGNTNPIKLDCRHTYHQIVYFL
jgi:ribosomal protein S10